MNIYEAKEFITKVNPEKKVSFGFDKKCIRSIEIIHTNGRAHDDNHIEYDQLMVTYKGEAPYYISISPHREVCSLDWIKNHVATA